MIFVGNMQLSACVRSKCKLTFEPLTSPHGLGQLGSTELIVDMATRSVYVLRQLLVIIGLWSTFAKCESTSTQGILVANVPMAR